LDNVYFGQKGPASIIGLGAAARHFFNKKPGELTLSQCALLAGLLRSPNGYSPFTHPQKALTRRNLVLKAMRQQGFIGSEIEAASTAKPLGVTHTGQRDPHASDYFMAFIQRLLAERYEDTALLTRGLSIYTTLDPWMQESAQKVLSKAPHQAALVALDPRSGAIRALVGGRNFSKSPFDRATQARRQPGSAFKPFVYGAALQAKDAAAQLWTPSSLLSDTTRTFRIEGGTWTPRNYTRQYHGRVPLRTAFALSLNAATVNLTSNIGPSRVITYAQSLGIRSPMRPELGISLGIFEVTLLELTGAYCAFANGGFRVEPYGIEAVLDGQGAVLEYHSPNPAAVLSPGEAYLMTDLLRAAVTDGTARSLSRWSLDKIAAGKTGTTNGGKDAWFVGYSPEIVAGVWTGSDRPAKLGITGANAALPLWARFFRNSGRTPLSKKSHPASWPQPEDIRTAIIDPASGRLARSGCPARRSEIFLAGSEPSQECPLHSGGFTGWFKKIFRGK
jgi:penicillin-binding protein 1B